MAEVVGLVASIATLFKCVTVVRSLTGTFQNYSERFESLEKTLTGVWLSSSMIEMHVRLFDGKIQDNTEVKEGIPAPPNVLHELDGRTQDLINKCLKNLQSLATLPSKKVKRMESAQKQERRLYRVFRWAKSAVRLSLSTEELENLISATKNVEGFLSVALIGLLCCHNKVQSIQNERFAEELRNQFEHQDKSFEELKQRLDSYQSPIITWEKVTATKSKRREANSRQEGLHDIESRNRDGESSETLPGTSTLSEQDRVNIEQAVPSRQIQDAAPENELVKDPIGSSTSTVTLDDGESLQDSVEVEDMLITLNSGLDKPVLHPTKPVSRCSSVISASETPDPPSDFESHTPSEANNENETWDSDFANQITEIALFDSKEVDVRSRSRVFKDVDTDLSTCFQSDRGVWKFCTKSLLLLGNGEATFVLKNPCKTYCEHISIQTDSAVGLDKPDLPQILEVSLYYTSTDIASPTTMQDQISFILLSSSRLKYLRTELSPKQDGMKWIAGRYELSMVADIPQLRTEEHNDEPRTLGDEEQNAEQVVIVEEGNGHAVEEEEEGDNDTANTLNESRELGPFSTVPCLFCRRDALNPRWSGSGHAGFLFGSNISLRMTCERCKDSTWISAMTWGPSFPGGQWHVSG